MPADIHEILANYWGYAAFRDRQEEIIQAVLREQDTLALLPTGGGKSVCYQVPALAQEGICLVISPLIALMKDQVLQLRRRGISALAIHTGMSYRELAKTMEMAVNEQVKFLYLSPERIQTKLFREYLPSMNITLLAIDEAHCISQWGYDFRPSYRQIALLREELPKVPVLALTASATELVQTDIIQQLNLHAPLLIKGSFARPALSYSVFEETDKWGRLAHILQRVGGCSIVYCRTRKKTVEISRYLNSAGIAATFYHAGLPADERNERQQQWMNNQQRVMVSTNAFGMGIDKADVRTVVHMDVPDCLENYYQEAGRAGRDREKSYAVLLYQQQDLLELEKQLEQKFPSLDIVQGVYRNLMHFLQIPEGAAEGLTYDFDLSLFCERFDMDRTTALQSMQILQTEGYCALNESAYNPATILVTARRAELEAVEQQHPALDELLKTILRSYEGLFNYPVAISETYLSKVLRRDRELIIRQLEQLMFMGLLTYEKQKDKPQFVLLAERMQAAHIRFDRAAQEKRKKLAQERLAKMKTYISSSDCRAVIIGRYFSDDTITDCGICDNCRQKKKAPEAVEPVAAQIRMALQTSRKEKLSSLRAGIQVSCNDDTWWKTLTWLEENGQISITEDGMVRWL
ncbi:MAG: RecQ family ATP-dependent DNA helicase [Bacteroidetes bacterium]|nr:RecQ family ATP-dependent DNA helicase [Bacteroidota bacterium]